MIDQPTMAGPVPWLALFAVDVALTAATLVVFGLFGGFVLLVALNGFSEAEGLRIMLVYALLVVAGNALAAALFNWLILRGRAMRPVPRRAVLAPALATTLALLVAGPPLAAVLIKLLFGS